VSEVANINIFVINGMGNELKSMKKHEISQENPPNHSCQPKLYKNEVRLSHLSGYSTAHPLLLCRQFSDYVGLGCTGGIMVATNCTCMLFALVACIFLVVEY
jgi:non-ribosomal peptide synthetase component E (peptide arylation enzyme)